MVGSDGLTRTLRKFLESWLILSDLALRQNAISRVIGFRAAAMKIYRTLSMVEPTSPKKSHVPGECELIYLCSIGV